MISTSFPFLSLVIFLPLAGAVALSCLPCGRTAKWAALFIAAAELLLTLWIAHMFDADKGELFQFVEKHSWIPYLNIHYLVGIDGISVMFLPFTALLMLTSLLAAWNSVFIILTFP